MKQLVSHHVSGKLKIAPEHTEKNILTLMGKPDISKLVQFKKEFDTMTRNAGKKQFLTYYLIAAHPGCREKDMMQMKQFVRQNLKIAPEQVQIFTPSPSTFSSLMYCTGTNPFTNEKIFVERNLKACEKQKSLIVNKH